MPQPKAEPFKHIKTVKRNGVSYLYFNTGEKVDGKPVYKALGRAGTIEVGSRYSAALAARTRRGGNPSSVLVPELMRRYQRSPEFTRKSLGTQKTYSVYLNRLARDFDTAPAGGLESSDVYELMDAIGKPAAVEMMILAGGQMFAWAKKRKYVAGNPFEGIDRETWEANQYAPWPEEVLEEAMLDPKLGLPVALMYFTAQRIGDCCNIHWVHCADGVVYVKQQKTGKELWIPVHQRLEAMLSAAPHAGPTVLTDPKGKKAKDGTIRQWVKLFGDKRGVHLVPHGLRKNAVNALLEAGCTTGETSSISGQSLRMVEHYARLRDNRKMSRKAIAKWEQSEDKETGGKIMPETAET